MGDQHMANMNT